MTMKDAALAAIAEEAVAELDAVHRPGAGKDPMGCVTCFPVDGGWPCVSRQVADDLRRVLVQHSLDG